MPDKAAIFVIDDDEAVRGAVSGLLEAQGYEVTAFPTAESFLAAKLDHQHGCAVVDIQMPGMSGLELQAELVGRKSALPLVFLTSHGDIGKAVTALKAGAVDFIEKPFRIDDLLRAVDEALRRARKSQGLSTASHDFVARRTSLTPREREVMDCMVDGAPNKQVAAKLGISVRTAEVHRAKVLEKMGCNSLSALIHLVLRNSPQG